LREICDFEKMIIGHRNYERRIGAGNDLALKRIGDSKNCSSKEGKDDQRSEGEPLHSSTINAICISQLESSPGAVRKRAVALWPTMESPDSFRRAAC
jgi:hypothetical protein